MRHELRTSLHFPIYELRPMLSYFKVEKPSGLSYMLLLFFSELRRSTIKLPNLFANFGIPESLHALLAKEIETLVESGVVKVKSGTYIRQDFNGYALNHFSLTPLGKEQLKKQRIPTHAKERFEKQLFYLPHYEQYALSINGKLGNASDSPLPRSLYDRHEKYSEESLKAFLKNTPNREVRPDKLSQDDVLHEAKLPEGFGATLKQEKYDFTLSTDMVTADIVFEDEHKTKFFNENYIPEILQDALKLKKKFTFPEGIKAFNRDLGTLDVKSIDFPKNFKTKLNKHTLTFVPKSSPLHSKENVAQGKRIDQALGETLKGAHIYWDKTGMTAYLGCEVTMKLRNLEKRITVPLTVVARLDESQVIALKKAFEKLLNESEHSKAFALAMAADRIDSEEDYVSQLFHQITPSMSVDELDMLLKAHGDILKDKPFVREHLMKTASKKLNDLNPDSLEHTLSEIRTLNDHLGHQSKISPETILEHYQYESKQNALDIYNTLNRYGFTNKVVFETLGIPERLMKSIIEGNPIPVDSKEADAFNRFNALFHPMCKQLKMTSPHDYDSSALQANPDKHIKTMNQLENAYNKIKAHAKDAPEEFDVLENYMRQFGGIKEVLIQLKNQRQRSQSSNEPIRIDFEMMSEVEIVATIAVRLERKLSKLTHTKDKRLEAMIDAALKSKRITSKAHETLHQFRIQRNQVLHHGKAITLTRNDLERITEIINGMEEPS